MSSPAEIHGLQDGSLYKRKLSQEGHIFLVSGIKIVIQWFLVSSGTPREPKCRCLPEAHSVYNKKFKS